MSWVDDVERAIRVNCTEFPRKGSIGGWPEILPAGVYHSPYTYGEGKRIFCGMCERLLSDADIALLRSVFTVGSHDSKTCDTCWSGRGR